MVARQDGAEGSSTGRTMDAPQEHFKTTLPRSHAAVLMRISIR
jgi:hypothetical protein